MSTQQTTFKDSDLVVFLDKLRNLIFYSMPGGPKLLPMRYIINTFKGLTFIWVLALMFYFNNFSTGMWLYLFLHGTYGICWLVKDMIFPDGTFKQRATFLSLTILTTFLTGYWCISLPLAAGYGIQSPSTNRIIFLIALYILGLILMMGADYQKTKTLSQKKGLISTGFFKITRNPNYLGEIFIYTSFALCSGHLFGYFYLIALAGLLFSINMYLKDKLSYEKKVGWQQYQKQSYILLPKIFSSDIINFAFYGATTLAVGYFLSLEQPALLPVY